MESIFKYFLLLLLATSCAGQGVDIKDKSSHNPQVTTPTLPSPYKGEGLGGGDIQRGEEAKRGPSGMQRKDYVPAQIIVKFKDGTDRQAIEAITNKLHLKFIPVVSSPNLYLMKIMDGSSVEQVMESLRDYEEVKYSEPNYVRTLQ